MRPPRGETCSADEAGRACPERWEAVLTGRFFWQDYVGWIWLDSVERTMPWDFCPWCGDSLPTLADEEPLGEEWTYDGEDGG